MRKKHGVTSVKVSLSCLATNKTPVLSTICNQITVQSHKMIPPTKCLVILIGNVALTLIE